MGGRNLKDYPRCPNCGFKKWVSRFDVAIAHYRCGRCKVTFGLRNGIPTEVQFTVERGGFWVEKASL